MVQPRMFILRFDFETAIAARLLEMNRDTNRISPCLHMYVMLLSYLAWEQAARYQPSLHVRLHSELTPAES
ncbi:hypothetical protein ARMGADRAFT_1016047 [Armillaria gallica]|uniref:Uncharacterized protein n=1 Tax=Armillaria gallica TaxID=47427 RepID=A0A2H3DJZ6_ARMGA|nr:hypothetical protein ARMGADRAFT_1016047 [Armillaria gallica]